MKTILLSLLSLFMLQGYSQENTPKHLRRAFQAEPSSVGAVQYGNNPSAGHYATTGDAKIYYEVYGIGQPLLVLHGGIFGSTIEMAPFIDSLKTKYQVIAVSTRGHGKSELGTAPHSYEQKAKDAIAVLNKVTTDSVIVLGFSDGGYTGYMLAAHYPQRVKKLIAIGAGERHPGDTPNSITVEDALKMDQAYWDQQLSLMPEPKRLPELFTKVQDAFNNKLVVDKALLGNIKVPVLVMAGDHDQFISADHAYNASKFIPKGQLSIIPNSTHGVFLEKFPLVWVTISDFLAY